MKILIISPGLLPIPATRGGAVETLIETIVKDDNTCKNNDITLYTIKTETDINASYKCNIKQIDNQSTRFRISRAIRHLINKIPNTYIGNAYITRVIKDIKNINKKFDVIIVENQPEYGLVLKNAFPHTKIILHLHNNYLNYKTKKATQIANSYDLIIPISNTLRKQVETIKHLKTKQVVLNNGINIDNYTIKDKTKIRNKYGLDKNDKIFLFTGRIVPEKGVSELLEAFKKLQKKKNTKLIIVGKTNNTNYCKRMINKINEDKNVIFFKNISYEKTPEIYSLADVGVIPSTWEEPFGLVLIELMASSCPVIISDRGEMKYLVNKTGKNAIITKYDKNFTKNLSENLKLLQDIDQITMSQMKASARENAKLYSNSKYLDSFNTIINEI